MLDSRSQLRIICSQMKRVIVDEHRLESVKRNDVPELWLYSMLRRLSKSFVLNLFTFLFIYLFSLEAVSACGDRFFCVSCKQLCRRHISSAEWKTGGQISPHPNLLTTARFISLSALLLPIWVGFKLKLKFLNDLTRGTRCLSEP